MSAEHSPKVESTYSELDRWSARRAIWQFCLLGWAFAALVALAFWFDSGVEPQAMAIFFLAEVGSCWLLRWLLRREHRLTLLVTTAMVTSNLLVVAVHWPWREALVAVCTAGLFLVLTWTLPPKDEPAPMADGDLALVVGAVAAIVLLDVLVVIDMINSTMGDDFCLVWCE